MSETENAQPTPGFEELKRLARMEPAFAVDSSEVRHTGASTDKGDEFVPAGGSVHIYGRRIAPGGPETPASEYYDEFVLLEIPWQDGVIDPEEGPNGVTVEALLDACVQRVKFLNEAASGKFRCRENSLSITDIESAVNWLNKRREDRMRRGVLNTHAV